MPHRERLEIHARGPTIAYLARENACAPPSRATPAESGYVRQRGTRCALVLTVPRIHTLWLLVVVALSSVACSLAPGDEGDEAEGTSGESALRKGKKQAEAEQEPERSLLVVNLNVENVPFPEWGACKGSGLDFVRFLAAEGDAPEVFTAQQVSGREQADAYAANLTMSLGKPYAALVSEDAPKPYTSGCPGLKDQQTNAIFFRTDRFAVVEGSAVRFQPMRSVGETCDEGNVSGQARTVALGVNLREIESGTVVSVVSMHFPRDDKSCMERNVDQALDQLDALGGELRVLAGDANVRDRAKGDFAPWCRRTQARAYVDPVVAKCDGKEGCLDENWSLENAEGTRSRIDFMFAKRMGGAGLDPRGVRTISFADVQKAPGAAPDLTYSDHRAQRARLSF